MSDVIFSIILLIAAAGAGWSVWDGLRTGTVTRIRRFERSAQPVAYWSMIAAWTFVAGACLFGAAMILLGKAG